MEYILAILLIVFGVYLYRRTVSRETVFEYERGLRYEHGKFERILEPGAYTFLARNTTIRKLDMRPRFTSITGQEVLSADNVGLRLSLAAQYVVTDPVAAISRSADYEGALYLELQLALREIVGALKIDDLLAARQQVGAQLAAQTEQNIAALGLKLLHVNIKDIMFPGELKKVFAQVVTAQKEGQAALEKARGESAALRNLANAARLLDDNPMLLQLRILQTLDARGGNTIVMGMQNQVLPLPTNTQAKRQNTGSAALPSDDAGAQGD